MSDVFSDYKNGLSRLLTELGDKHDHFTDALTLQTRLLENIEQAQLFGDTETRRADRAQILDALNRLTVETLGVSFNELFRIKTASNISKAAPDNNSNTIEVKKTSQANGNINPSGQTTTSHETHFYGPVTGSIHTGSGDIQIETNPSESTSDAAEPSRRRFSRSLLIVIGAIAAVVLGVASNIVAAYLQERYNLITDQGRIWIVVIVFVVALVIGILVALKQGQEST